MHLDFSNLSKAQSYHVMTHCIVPRPIAWILTTNENGSYNLAPFSYFQAIGSKPATVMVSIGFKADGGKKDTLVNLEREQHCVMHIANVEQVNAVNLSAKPLPYNESETELCTLSTTTVDGWSLPRLTDASVAFYCRLIEVNVISGMNVVFAEARCIWIDDAITEPAPMGGDVPDLPNPKKLDPLARLGFRSYAALAESFELERPT
ncbi:flavin reductase family protein [Cerasicoccus frondis]|uniref:flavin reductase family protein n=1 Tax=Cerasicoccus frondis TaxID=490090 RepID=UPI002852CFFA|nr:flavin reductase family protein [Cerasicoccus frondis]